jgi:CheY-like chemotaxis protein
MSFTVRLLIVEDNLTEQETWKSTIEMHNSDVEENGFGIDAYYAVSMEQAADYIGKSDYDAAVVDIRLEQSVGSSPNADGNLVVERLLQSELAVIAVFTGEHNEVKIPQWATSLVQTFRKGGDEGEGTSAVMGWLIQNMPMVRPIRKAQLAIKHEMVQLFTKSIWPRWSQWMQAEGSNDAAYLELALSRHLASHVHAVLLEGSSQRVHPEEWYFIPPVRDGIRTGDILKTTDAKGVSVYEIVVTPRCDLAIAKNNTIQLAQCKDVAKDWDTLCTKLDSRKAEHDAENDNEKKKIIHGDVKKFEEQLRKYTQHANNKAVCHFLPRMMQDGIPVGPLLVQFDHIRSVGTDQLNDLGKSRIASLTPEFLPSLVERLGGFFSRIGTPDYSHPD